MSPLCVCSLVLTVPCIIVPPPFKPTILRAHYCGPPHKSGSDPDTVCNPPPTPLSQTPLAHPLPPAFSIN